MSDLKAVNGTWSAEYARTCIRASNLDEAGVIRNDRTGRPYLPANPGRRRNLLKALGYIEKESDDGNA